MCSLQDNPGIPSSQILLDSQSTVCVLQQEAAIQH